MLKEFPEDLGKTAETQAGDHLFTVQDNNTCRPLHKKQAQICYRTVTQVIFLATRSCHNSRITFAFITARVKDPDEDDWAKLHCLLRYLKRNPGL